MPYGTDGTYRAFDAPVRLSLHEFRLCDANGAVGNTVANGGILASDTVPIMRNTSGVVSQEISWAASNSQPILYQVTLPKDFDGRQDVTLDLRVNSGTTDAASFTILSSWDGGTNVSTTATDPAKSATYHIYTVVIPAASIPDSASFVTFHFTPAAHTTNAVNLGGVRLNYAPRRVS